MSDRSIDRRIGVWSNNMHSHTNVGIATTEDIYFASIHLNGTDAASPVTAAGVPAWMTGGVGLLVGMGLALLLAGAAVRRSRGGRAPT